MFTDKKSRKILREVNTSQNDADMLFQIAEEYYDLWKNSNGKRTRYLKESEKAIKLGLMLDIERQPFFHILNQNSITIILPKSEVENTDMYFDGFEFYSLVINELLLHLLKNKVNKIVLSMKNVSCFSDLGPGILAMATSECKKRNGDLKLFEIQPAVKKVMTILLDDRIEIYSNLETALMSFESK